MPDEPPSDEITRYVLNTYAGITRGRRYLPPAMGGKSLMLPIGAREIEDWLRGHPPALDRAELDAAVFALDERERTASHTEESQ